MKTQKSFAKSFADTFMEGYLGKVEWDKLKKDDVYNQRISKKWRKIVKKEAEKRGYSKEINGKA